MIIYKIDNDKNNNLLKYIYFVIYLLIYHLTFGETFDVYLLLTSLSAFIGTITTQKCNTLIIVKIEYFIKLKKKKN
ncbi:hypothetical protein BpHYR1_039218 [Brachionus plicatilis]|uniref:Uncharacterized protein n=1 Tax=Brachionus plicatilis TaxID=10195 RepID=A0A3M7QVT4_BRAPC|nr:hypothetical protein BpHYR1_039218 [Brachionus plicatilis]